MIHSFTIHRNHMSENAVALLRRVRAGVLL
jgi:hypothetical protein